VQWEQRRNLFFSGPADRHYAIDRARGWQLFGDGVRGRTPPIGAAILARQYRTGGGVVGNVQAHTVTQLLGPIGGIEEAFNPVPAEGGADAETPEQVAGRGPRTLHHRGRAISARDYETMAIEASPAVAVAHAIGGRDSAGHDRAGWVTLIVVPRSSDPRPWPSFGLREEVRQYIADRAPASLAAGDRLYVTGPLYTAVDVTAELVPKDPDDAGGVETRAHDAVAAFLHPLIGGVQGTGWPAGRSVFLSDVAAVLGRTEGLDYVLDLALAINGELKGEEAAIPRDHVVVAGDSRLKTLERQP
jgi:predicted phage baseplate assembly protein